MAQISRKDAAEALALVALCQAVIETVEECAPAGFVPEGALYTAFSMRGMDLHTFNRVIALCLKSGKVKRGPMHTLLPGDKGKTDAVQG